MLQAQDYAEGISYVTTNTTSSDLYTVSETYITYNLQAYYDPQIAAQLLDNGSQIATGSWDPQGGQIAELDGHVAQIKLGETYEIDADHYLLAFYEESDGSGGYYFDNPEGFGFTENTEPSGYDYTEGTPGFIVVEQIYLGNTTFAVSTALPQLTAITPQAGVRGTSGTITLTGTGLLDVLSGTSKPTVSGSGVTLTLAGSPTATQIKLNYSIDLSATDGARQITIATRFGTSNAKTFTVGDPPAQVTSLSPSSWQAGTNFTLINGTGFGTIPTVTVSGAVGVTAGQAFNSNAAGTQTQVTISVAQNAPNGTAIVTIQPYYAGSGYTCGSCGNGSSGIGSDNAPINSATPQPQITFNDASVSGTTQTVMAGQKISLSVNAPSGYSVQSQSWSFANEAAITGGFVNQAGSGPPSASSGGTEAVDPPLNQSTLTFYWVNPQDTGDKVTYTYLLDNEQSASATVTFNVGGPTGNLLIDASIQTDQSGTHVTFPTTGSARVASFNSPEFSNVGINFRSLATAPAGANQSFMWVQVLQPQSYSVISSVGSRDPVASTPQGLDGTYPYAIPSNASTNDSPNQVLPSICGEVKRFFDATMYLMWDPALPSGCQPAKTDPSTPGAYTSTASTCSSIPIPLSSVRWKWSACAINTLTPDGTSLSWLLHCGAGLANTPQQDGYPQWTVRVPSDNAP